MTHVKPKQLSKVRRKWLENLSRDASNPPAMRWSQEVLAALEYERQRADMATECVRVVRETLGARDMEATESAAQRVAVRAGLRVGSTTPLDSCVSEEPK